MRRSIKYGLYGALLAAVVGGTAAFAAGPSSKAVTLVVDDQARQIHTTAATVDGALSSAGYHLGAHDLVAPAPTAKVRAGSSIVYDRGRELRLDVDGVTKDVWTTAPTVAVALAQLGYPTSDFVSVSRSQRLPLTVTDVALRAPKAIQLVLDGHAEDVSTTAASVAEVLSQLGVSLGANDRVAPSAATSVSSGLRIVVQRVSWRQDTVTQQLDYATTTVAVPTAYQGQSQVVTSGATGSATVVYNDVFVDGKLAGRTLIKRTVVQAPTTKVVRVGTKPRPVTVQAPAGNATGGLDWAAVAACESGGDWSIDTGNGFYGGLQFDRGTWLAYGGGAYGATANLASEGQQITVADRLYAARGSSPWPVCGAHL